MASSPVPKDSPVMIAWEAYKSEADYANTRRWALHEEHVDGSLWAAFNAGHFAAHSVIAGKVAELTEALRNAREAIASLETEALGMAVIGFGDPERDTYPIRDELLAKIDAALAPYPERRSES